MSEILTANGDSKSNGTKSKNFNLGKPRKCIPSEIEEMESSNELFEISETVPLPSIREEITGSVFSFDFHGGDDIVYVAVGKNTIASVDALVWTLKNAVSSSTLVFLIHIYPELRFIPTPLGKLPVSQVNPEQKHSYEIEEHQKRKELLQKFIDMCSRVKVKVDTILIESDGEDKALLDLIPILNVQKLVLGTTKSTLRKARSRRGSGSLRIAEVVLPEVPEFCEVKIICEGKEVTDNLPESPSSSGRAESPKTPTTEDDSFGCCLRPKVIE